VCSVQCALLCYSHKSNFLICSIDHRKYYFNVHPVKVFYSLQLFMQTDKSMIISNYCSIIQFLIYMQITLQKYRTQSSLCRCVLFFTSYLVRMRESTLLVVGSLIFRWETVYCITLVALNLTDKMEFLYSCLHPKVYHNKLASIHEYMKETYIFYLSVNFTCLSCMGTSVSAIHLCTCIMPSNFDHF
jgi:hypothetical protein